MENGGELNGRIQAINSALTGAAEVLGPVKLAIVPIGDLDFLEENARFMRNETFRNLIDNIKRDGALTSVPYCWLNKEIARYLVLSGNHRVKAAREAGQQHILIMFNDEALSEQERIAIQLSHNAIAGEDDPVILKSLWDKIKEVDLKCYAGLDDKTLKELAKLTLNALSEVRLDFRTLSFAFLPEEAERVRGAFEEAKKLITSKEIYLARFAEFDRLIEAQAKARAAYNIKNAATSMMVILDLFERHLLDLSEGWEHRADGSKISPVPLASIFGVDAVPLEAAKTILKATRAAVDAGNTKEPWRVLLLWAENYLHETDGRQLQ